MAVRKVYDSDGKAIASYIHAGCNEKVVDQDPDTVWIYYFNPPSEFDELMILEKINKREGKTFTTVCELLFREEE